MTAGPGNDAPTRSTAADRTTAVSAPATDGNAAIADNMIRG